MKDGYGIVFTAHSIAIFVTLLSRNREIYALQCFPFFFHLYYFFPNDKRRVMTSGFLSMKLIGY